MDDATIPVLHLWGTPYEKGYAHGSIMKEQLSTFFPLVWGYAEKRIEKYLAKVNITGPFAQQIADWLLDTGLDLERTFTQQYTGQYFLQEMQGLSDATGIDVKMIYRVHLLGELTKGTCSMFGGWGDALATPGLLSVRALDWIMDGPFQDYTQLSVYHAQNDSEIDFVNIGWT